MSDPRTTAPNKLDKRLLVFFRKFKSVEDVPNLLPASTISHARNKGRIWASVILMGVLGVVTLFDGYRFSKAYKDDVKTLRERKDF